MSKIDELPITDQERHFLAKKIIDPTVPHGEISSHIAELGHVVSERSVRRYRQNLGIKRELPKGKRDYTPQEEWKKAEIVVHPDGGTLSTGTLDAPIELAADWEGVLKGFGLSSDSFEIEGDTVRMSKFQQSKRLENGDRDVVWLYSYSAKFRKKADKADRLDLSTLQSHVRSWKPVLYPVPVNTPVGPPTTLVVCWADWQLAKSERGGTGKTVERVLESFQLTAQRIIELRAMGRNIEKVAVINMGDPIEGCLGHYDSQLFTVELTQREQLNLALDLWTQGLLTLDADIFASVLSNHAEWTRTSTGGKPQTSDSDNADGFLSETLKRVFDASGKGPSEWYIPHDEMVSMVNLSGLDVAITHGHKIPSPAKELDWLRGQSIRLLREYGREPRLWLTAHLHHVRVDDYGPWWRLQCPTLDGGSKYFTDRSSTWSTPGTLTFLAGQHDPRGFSDLAILGTGYHDD